MKNLESAFSLLTTLSLVHLYVFKTTVGDQIDHLKNNVPKWLNTLSRSCSIFKVCPTILGRNALKY